MIISDSNSRRGSRISHSLAQLLLILLLACSPAFGAVTFLQTRGQDMVDESGNKVLLRGVGLGNWMLPEGYMWKFGDQGDRPRKIEKLISDLIGEQNANRFWSEFRKSYITEADIKRIAELGFNSVRPALNARLFLSEEEKPVYLEEGFELLDTLIKWCKKNDIYVIIDMHGAPGGQTGANIDDSADDQPRVFMDKKYEDRLVDLWVKIAERYKDEPAVAAYDLLNEPLPSRTGAAAKHKDQLEPLYKRLTQAIRAVDRKHMITVEGCDWANDWSVFTTPFDSNLVYQFHYYCWDQPTTLKSVGQYIAKRSVLNAPVWVGETGEKDDAIYWGTMQYFEENNIGWSFWPWKKMGTVNTPYSILPPPGWEAIRAYSQGKAKPSPEVAQKAFDGLLQNIRLENCVYYPDVVNALFRRVPGKIEAENYGHEGLNKSYWVKENTQKSKLYRKDEAVPVVSMDGTNAPRRSGQAIQLATAEWVAYTIFALEQKEYAATIKLSAEGPATLRLSMGDQTRAVTVTNTGWTVVAFKSMSFKPGANRLKLAVDNGSVCVDWVAFDDSPRAEKKSARRALVLSEKGGQHGPFVEAARAWLRDFAAKEHFDLDYFENTKEINAATLARYQVFIQLNYAPYGWTPEAMSAFSDYIEEGRGGWVGFHHATLLGDFDGYKIWPWFSDFMGGVRFKNYIASFVSGNVQVEDRNHPCMRGISSSFPIVREEWYTYDRSPRANVRVLASVDELSYSPTTSITMGDHPVIWTNEHFPARNIYIFMGHGPELFENANYTTLLRNSVLWASGQD